MIAVHVYKVIRTGFVTGDRHERLPRAAHAAEDVQHGGGVRHHQEVRQGEAELRHEAQQHQVEVTSEVKLIEIKLWGL